MLLQDELENRINYYLKNQPFPLDILDLTAHRSGIFEIFSAWPINPVCQQSNSRQRATNSIQTTRANKRQGPTNKQTNKQANKQVMGHGGALGMRDGGWRMGGAKHREEARSAKQQPYRQRRSSTNETCEWRPTSTQAEAAAIEPASGAQNWRK